MPAKQQKDGTWRVKKKDGTLGKTKFKTQKAALARSRGSPGKKPGSKGGKKPGKAVAKKGDATPAKPPKIGASYSAGMAGAMALSPLTAEVLRGIEEGLSPREVIDRTATKILTIPYAYNLALIGVDAAVDRKTAQATAITMGSGTAILPEIYLASEIYEQARKGGSPQAVAARAHEAMVVTHQGYNPKSGAFATGDKRFRTYRLLKHGGQAIRMVRGKSGIVRRITAPIARFAKALGGRI